MSDYFCVLLNGIVEIGQRMLKNGLDCNNSLLDEWGRHTLNGDCGKFSTGPLY